MLLSLFFFFFNNCTCKEVILHIQPWAAINCSDLLPGRSDCRIGPLAVFKMRSFPDVFSAPHVQNVTFGTPHQLKAIVPIGLAPEERCLWVFPYRLFFFQDTFAMKWPRRHQLTSVNFGATYQRCLYSLRGPHLPCQKKIKNKNPEGLLLSVTTNLCWVLLKEEKPHSLSPFPSAKKLRVGMQVWGVTLPCSWLWMSPQCSQVLAYLLQLLTSSF